jgi:mRNA interferase YafQ
MREIKYTSRFKKDYKREKRGRHSTILDNKVLSVIRLLIEDSTLPEYMHDHALTGNWKDCRDCHIKPDLILIYRKPSPKVLELIRLGSHSELGL